MPTRQKDPTVDASGTITAKQMRELHALLRDHGITGDTTVHEYLNVWLLEHDDDQHPIESRADLSAVTAARLIRDLRREDVARAPGGLVRAMLAVQAALPVVQKSKTARVPMKGGGQYSYTYADLGDVTAAAIPLLNANGLVFTATPRRTESGSYELAGRILHESGESIEGALPLHGNDPQQIGGALTYHRRYLLGCLLGIVTDDDADGRQAVGAAHTTDWTGPSTSELLNAIDTDAARAGVTYEQATAKFREQRGMALDDLDLLDPWVLAPLAKAVKDRADEVVAAREKAAAPAEATPEPGGADDPWATPAVTP